MCRSKSANVSADGLRALGVETGEYDARGVFDIR